MDDLFDVHAIKWSVGWKIMLVMKAFPEPLLSSCRHFPSSAENILMIVPLVEAEATKVPSALTASAPTSDS